MEITEVKVFPIDEEKLRAFVSVVFDRCFMVNDIKIIQGRQGLFLSMPSRRKKNGEFKDVAHPLNNDTRRRIESRILAEYERVLEERGERLEAELRPVGRDVDDAGGQPASREQDEAAEQTEEAAREETTAEEKTRERAAGSEEAEARSSGEKPTEEKAGEDEPGEEPTLEEVTNQHLRDSFWTVP